MNTLKLIEENQIKPTIEIEYNKLLLDNLNSLIASNRLYVVFSCSQYGENSTADNMLTENDNSVINNLIMLKTGIVMLPVTQTQLIDNKKIKLHIEFADVHSAVCYNDVNLIIVPSEFGRTKRRQMYYICNRLSFINDVYDINKIVNINGDEYTLLYTDNNNTSYILNSISGLEYKKITEIFTTQEYGRYQIIDDMHSLTYEELNLLLKSNVLMRCRGDKSIFGVSVEYTNLYVEDML